MGALAYVEPELVIPVVCQHFEEALSTFTATHQLVASLDALAVCVRPMLLYDNTLNDTPVDVLVAQVPTSPSALPALRCTTAHSNLPSARAMVSSYHPADQTQRVHTHTRCIACAYRA
jgi:hypothetical protein